MTGKKLSLFTTIYSLGGFLLCGNL